MKVFFYKSDILTNIFIINTRYFFTILDMLTMRKVKVFIKAQLKLVKMTSGILTNVDCLGGGGR